MSDMKETIDRLEQWVEYWEPHQVPELIADLRALIATAKAAQRAAELLQNAQRYDYGSEAYMEDPLQPSEAGDWILIDDVVKAIQILQEPIP